MIRSFLTKVRESAAVMYTFGGEDSRFFPGYIAIAWRDTKGFNPAFMAMVTQTGQRDPHLLPCGWRPLIMSWHMFGGPFGRCVEE